MLTQEANGFSAADVQEMVRNTIDVPLRPKAVILS